MNSEIEKQDRLHALDALRAFALLLGIFYHAALSFVPQAKGWAILDNSPSVPLTILVGISHVFRMSLFFFIAGFFAHLVYHRKGAAAFARDRTKRIVWPFLVGWSVMLPLLGAIWAWGRSKAGILASLGKHSSPSALGDVSLTHLWFLYYLILIYILAIGSRHLLIDHIDGKSQLRTRIDRMLQTLLEQRWAPLVLSLPLAMAAIFDTHWNPAGGMPTPDHSVIPELVPLVGYGVAFTVGWIFHRNLNLLQILTQRMKSNFWLAFLAAIAVSVVAVVSRAKPELAPITFQFLSGLTATMMMWYFNLALVGLALQKFSNPNPKTRYVADASYWLYICHLPIVCALQVWVAYWPIHWTFKYLFIVFVTFPILFASYHYCVRFTALGAVLNGRKMSHKA